MTPVLPEKPSISVRIWFNVCSRSSFVAKPPPPDRVDLVDEDDARRVLLRVGEERANAACADADKHLDELRARRRDERHARLARDRAREQRLARARRALEQHAARRLRADLGELRARGA